MIIEYVKGFLVLFLLIKVLLYFVPKNSFAKYIAFFSGVILVIGILQPLFSLFGQEKYFLEYGKWEKELLELAEEAEEIQEEGKIMIEELSDSFVVEKHETEKKMQAGTEYE